MDTTAEPAYVVTLVHGTWADTKGWVAPGSFMRRELEDRLGLSRASASESRGHVVFREFPWMSVNTHAARVEASLRLAQFIRGGHATHPGARHVIVAHSHGGNVALYAMRDAEACQIISGIATLATPFLNTRRRQFRPYVDLATWLLLAAPIVLGALVIAALPIQPLRLAWMVGGIALMAVSDRPVSKWLIGLARRLQADIIAAVEPPPIEPARLLILSSRGDEARGWLRTWDVVAQAPFVIVGPLLSVVGVVANIMMNPRFHAETRSDVFFLATVVLLVVLLFSGLIRWPGYGRESLWAHLLVAIRADRTPRARGGRPHTAYAFAVERPSGSIRRRLRHKAICNDAAVVSAIVEWIRSGLRPDYQMDLQT